MPIIDAKNISIRYITGDFKDIGIKEYVLKKLKGQYHVTEFWADRDVSFQLEKGDMLGIIGSNGAGKSTLLKAISGIMVPTRGSLSVKGSIAALLELTSGFDPELTVRENTYLRGAMLGYTRAFMDEKYNEIIEFAELEDFQDRPFKQLSSGMKSRLAFSIACLVKPDILILDEVLSVGDGSFKKKSGQKMEEILASGVTSILVSHSLHDVRTMCNKVLWLEKGEQIVFTDDVDFICDAYGGFLLNKRIPKEEGDFETLAEEYQNYIAEENEKKAKETKSRLMALSEEAEESDTAYKEVIRDAIGILKKYKPDELRGQEADFDYPDVSAQAALHEEEAAVGTTEINYLTCTAEGIKITWTKVDGAVRYEVYSHSGYGIPKWTYLDTVTETEEELQVYDARIEEPGKWYSFAVRAVTKDGMRGAQSRGKSLLYRAPVTTVGAESTQNGVKVTFETVEAGYTYRLYRSMKTVEGWTSYEKITDVVKAYEDEPKIAEVYDSEAQSGETYRYYVRCISKGGAYPLSSYKNTVEIECRKPEEL